MARSHEEIASSLVECLKEVSSLLEHAHDVALKEQDALVKNDAEAITLSCKLQEEILRRISDSDQRAAAIAEQIAESAGMDPDETNAESIAEAAGFPYSDLIKQETAKISIIAEKVQYANEINSQLLQNGLEIIASCFKTLASDNNSPGAYSAKAAFVDAEPFVISLDLRA